jgi:hypothetical protein
VETNKKSIKDKVKLLKITSLTKEEMLILLKKLPDECFFNA